VSTLGDDQLFLLRRAQACADRPSMQRGPAAAKWERSACSTASLRRTMLCRCGPRSNCACHRSRRRTHQPTGHRSPHGTDSTGRRAR
jgi:hypothetical protein